MSKIFKVTTLLSAILILSPTFANYRMTIPLESNIGGRLPNGSINFNQKDNENNQDNSVSNNCVYDNTHYVEVMNQDNYHRRAKAGDATFVVNANVISIYSPSNNEFPKPGLSYGKEMETYPEASYFEICGDNLESYPPIGNPDGPEPVDENSGPDWTPECILNTTSDYAAINTTNGTRMFNSVTFGLTNFASPKWYYVPDNYDPENPSSYIYFDQQESEGGSRVTGPNPDYTYAPLCRVRKMLL